MRRFLVGVVVDALIVFIVLELLSLLSVPQPFPFGTTRVPIVTINAAGIGTFLAAGIAIGLVNRLVRPLVVAVTGRLVLSTMGAFLIVINAILLWIASLFVGSLAISASPQLLWFLVIAAIYTLLAMLAGALLGLNIPDIDESGRGRLIWRILDVIPTPTTQPDHRERPAPAGLRHDLPVRPGRGDRNRPRSGGSGRRSSIGSSAGPRPRRPRPRRSSG